LQFAAEGRRLRAKKKTDFSQRSRRTQRRREEQKEEALEGDYMD
jgi:hypothetical protein